ncbi:MAG: DegV family EDD domain-containing protein [Lachnospiraceae bacterium]|nr:DegV family EDD domain-containing protein [Lachnospiraceae bacterium]
MRILNAIRNKLINPDVSYEEKTLLLIATMGEISMFIMVICDIIFGESIVEMIALAAMLVGVPIVTALSVKFDKVKLGCLMQVIALIVFVLPVCFIFGGGLMGGGVFWVIFTFMVIGVTLSGKLRIAMMLILTAEMIAGYRLWYVWPDLFVMHDDWMFLVDTFVSCILVGLATYVMLRYQKNIFADETRRALTEKMRAEELNRSQNQFFSSMSHEIRTPINSILGLNELIMRREDISEDVRRDVANIQGAGKMLLALVNDILDLSKIEAGKMDIVPVNYNVGNLVSEIVNMIWLRADQKGLKFNVDIDPAIPSELFGDDVRIKQILINLLNNAVKYTQEGSIGLHMECEEVTADGVNLNFTITDTGMGIKSEALPHLFDTFKRVDEQKNRMIEGTGLGLSIVRQLVTLMDGKISVNSVYTQGSTFSVSLWQKITNTTPIGDINIASLGEAKHYSKYEAAFFAPDARVLIIDDNEMNLEVETKLLADTGMSIDTALSGMEALSLTLSKRYDVIFTDHLMPGMDGIEFLASVRKQSGGLNNRTPVIILTANAGSDNKELYNKSGFDGYIVKPVSGKQLEACLLKNLPESKVTRKASADISKEVMNTAEGYRKKAFVTIATSSMCDLPLSVIRELGINIIPFSIHMEGGVFYDGREAGSDDLLRYMSESDGKFDSEPPTEEDFTEFFGRLLKNSHHVIYLALTTSMSDDYVRAVKAAGNFDNVTVINSECLSSSLGLLTLIAHQLVLQQLSPEQIVKELNEIKHSIHCSFVVSVTDYLHRRGFISKRIHEILKTLYVRPVLRIKNDNFGVGNLLIGDRRKCYAKYINTVLSRRVNPDREIIFVTYVDMTEEELLWIEERIRRKMDFEHIVFQKASAAISLNCGPGVFGLLYLDNTGKNYNLGRFLPLETELTDSQADDFVQMEDIDDVFAEMDSGFVDYKPVEVEELADAGKEDKWYYHIEGINGAVAIKNSGSEDAFNSVLKIFYESIQDKYDKIKSFYEGEDWENYIITVHALKSSARLVGALDLGENAQNLELAGKDGHLDYIRANHEDVMEEFLAYKEKLAPFFEEKASDKPVMAEDMLEIVYKEMREAAEAMDSDTLDAIFDEMAEYSVEVAEESVYEGVKKAYEAFDYYGIIKILDENNK